MCIASLAPRGRQSIATGSECRRTKTLISIPLPETINILISYLYMLKSQVFAWHFHGDSLVATRESRGDHEGITSDWSKARLFNTDREWGKYLERVSVLWTVTTIQFLSHVHNEACPLANLVDFELCTL